MRPVISHPPSTRRMIVSSHRSPSSAVEVGLGVVAGDQLLVGARPGRRRGAWPASRPRGLDHGHHDGSMHVEGQGRRRAALANASNARVWPRKPIPAPPNSLGTLSSRKPSCTQPVVVLGRDARRRGRAGSSGWRNQPRVSGSARRSCLCSSLMAKSKTAHSLSAACAPRSTPSNDAACRRRQQVGRMAHLACPLRHVTRPCQKLALPISASRC